MNSSIDFNKPLPPLKRSTEAIQIEHKNQPMILLKDQEQITDGNVVIPLPLFLIALMCDGKNTLRDIKTELTKQSGQVISDGELQKIIADLDEYYLLETPRLKQKRDEIWNAFEKNPLRPPSMAAQGYPSDSLELARVLGAFFHNDKGPKKTQAGKPIKKSSALGLISPHIDFNRGGPAYAWAYQALSEFPPPDVVIALGVAHMSPNSPWVFTQKEYLTPYGGIKIHEDLYKELGKRLWYDPAADQWVHRNEHSLEFQAVWLKYLWKDNTPPWIPILCSSFDRFCPNQPPSSVGSIEDAIQLMGQALINFQKSGKTVLILGGVDLAHVGPRFGDDKELTAELRNKIKIEDQASIDKALQLDADGFYMSVVADDHWRKVCGLSAIYTAIRLIKILRGENSAPGQMLTYDQADDPLGGVVSFTSAIFERA